MQNCVQRYCFFCISANKYEKKSFCSEKVKIKFNYDPTNWSRCGREVVADLSRNLRVNDY